MKKIPNINEAIRHQDHLYDVLTGDISDLEQVLTGHSLPFEWERV